MHEKLERHEKRVGELEEERKADMAERKESETRLKEMYEDRLRTIHESHLIDLKQSAELQKIKMNHLEDVESSLRDSKPRRLTSEEMTAREMSISAQDKKLKGKPKHRVDTHYLTGRADLQEEVDKQMAVLEGERSALQMKVEEFQSRNQRERNGLELDGKELKRSVKAFEDRRKAWEREKKSEIQYIESRKQELEASIRETSRARQRPYLIILKSSRIIQCTSWEFKSVAPLKMLHAVLLSVLILKYKNQTVHLLIERVQRKSFWRSFTHKIPSSVRLHSV